MQFRTGCPNPRTALPVIFQSNPSPQSGLSSWFDSRVETGVQPALVSATISLPLQRFYLDVTPQGSCRNIDRPPSANHARNPPSTRSDTDQTPTSSAES